MSRPNRGKTAERAVRRPGFDRSNPTEWVRVVLCVSLLAGIAWFVATTLRWQMTVDTPIMHYANFEIAHGVQPYGQLQDNNLPGAYMAEWFGMHVFGSGDLAWRLFEYFELAISTACLIWIAWPYDWAAGLFAGGFFIVLHGTEGPAYSGEREVALTALILCGYAALFLAQRRDRPVWMLPMGFAMAFAAAIKPTVAPLPLILLAAVIWLRRRDRQPWAAPVLWAVFGGAFALALVVGYLFTHHAFGEFVHMQRIVTTYYAQAASYTVPQMIRFLPLSHIVDGIVLVALLLRLSPPRRRWTSEQWLLLAGVAIGVLSFVAQRKNFSHHRYLFLALLLLLAGIALMRALRERTGWGRWAAAALALYIAVRVVPAYANTTHQYRPASDLTMQLSADLQHLGGTAQLQRRVVCLDQVFGCLNALYRLRIVENFPLSGDLLLFAQNGNAAAVQEARAMFWKSQQIDPADIVVLTNENFLRASDWTRLAAWPEYEAFLAAHYRVLAERLFPCEASRRGASIDVYRYRVYVRVDSGFSTATLPPQPASTCPA